MGVGEVGAEHRLVSYNVQGRPPVQEMVYDAEGRLASTTGDGVVVRSESHDLDAFETVIVGPDPRLTNTNGFDTDGMLVAMVQEFVDENGVFQSFVTSMTYNSDLALLEAGPPRT